MHVGVTCYRGSVVPQRVCRWRIEHVIVTISTVDESFRTYLNYLRHLKQLLQLETPDKAVESVVESKAFSRIQGGRVADDNLRVLGQLVRNAWFTEALIDLAGSNPDLLPYANNWAPIQFYYVIYLTVRALMLAKGQHVSADHTSTLNALVTELRLRPQLFPPPLRALCTGDPDAGPISLEGFVGVPNLQAFSTLSERSDPWASLATFLKTTRRRDLARRIADWKSRNDRQRISRQQRSEVAEALPPTSVFHAVYRLRVRSNYVGADDFLRSMPDRHAAARYNEALRAVGWRVMLSLELLIARYLGKRRYQEILDGFVKLERGDAGSGLAPERARAFLSAW